MEQLKSNNKVVLKGKILSVEAPTTVGSNGTEKQTIMFSKPPYTDSFGETKGKEEIWALDVIGKKVKELGLTDAIEGKFATVAFYVSSNEIVSKNSGEVMHIINTSLVEVQIYQANGGRE